MNRMYVLSAAEDTRQEMDNNCDETYLSKNSFFFFWGGGAKDALCSSFQPWEFRIAKARLMWISSSSAELCKLLACDLKGRRRSGFSEKKNLPFLWQFFERAGFVCSGHRRGVHIPAQFLNCSVQHPTQIRSVWRFLFQFAGTSPSLSATFVNPPLCEKNWFGAFHKHWSRMWSDRTFAKEISQETLEITGCQPPDVHGLVTRMHDSRCEQMSDCASESAAARAVKYPFISKVVTNFHGLS